MTPTANLPSAQDALTTLNSFQQPDSGSLLSAAQQKYGVQGLQDRVNTYKTLTNNLTGAISAVDPSVTGRTAGSLVTEGQRSALVDRERTPLVGQLGTAQQGESEANNDLGKAETDVNNEVSSQKQDAQNKYNQLLQTYQIANEREQSAAQEAADAAKQKEAIREFDVGQANDLAKSAAGRAASAPNPAAGYSVKQLTSGNKAYTGPNGQTNLYQYASAIAGGDPNGTYNEILGQLKTGSPTDKAAFNKVAKMSMPDAINYLKTHNSYIFD